MRLRRDLEVTEVELDDELDAGDAEGQSLPVNVRPTWLGKKWQPWEWFTPAAIGVACIPAGLLIHKFDLSGWLVIPTAIALVCAALGSVFNGAQFSHLMQMTMLAGSSVVAGWLIWSLEDSHWESGRPGIEAMASVLLPLIIVGTPVWKGARYAQLSKEEKNRKRYLAMLTRRAQRRIRRESELPAPPPMPAAPPPPPEDPEKLRWQAMPWLGGTRPSRITYVESIDPPNGGRPIVHMRVPADGSVTLDDLFRGGAAKRIEVRISSEEGVPLPPGAVTLERFRHERPDGPPIESTTDFLVHINDNNLLSQILWIVEDNQPRSVVEPIRIGEYIDGTPCYITVMEILWWIVGQTGNGKSNLLHRIIYVLTLCEDCAVLGTDRKGGNLFKPWYRAWWERAIGIKNGKPTGKPVKRPPIDWAGVDRFECERIWRFVERVVDLRPALRTEGDSHIPTKEDPLLVLISDEHGQLVNQAVGPRYSRQGKGITSVEFADIEYRISARARSEGVCIIKASQRGTNSASGSGDSTHNYKGHITLGAADLSDAGYTQAKSPDAARAANSIGTVGAAVVSTGSDEDRAVPVRLDYLGNDKTSEKKLSRFIYNASRVRGEIVPGLTPGTWLHQLACDEFDYETRFEEDRFWWFLGKISDGRPLNSPDDLAAAAGSTTTATATATATMSPSDLQADLARRRALQAAAETAAQAGGPAAQASGDSKPIDQLDFLDGATIDPEWMAELNEIGKQLEANAGNPPALEETSEQAPAVGPEKLDRAAVRQARLEAIENEVKLLGPSGGTWTELIESLVRKGILDKSNATQLNRDLTTLLERGKVDKPGGKTGRWTHTKFLRDWPSAA